MGQERRIYRQLLAVSNLFRSDSRYPTQLIDSTSTKNRMAHGGTILSDIYEKLSTSKIQVYDDCVRHRDIISRANTLADSLLTTPPSVESFKDFLLTTYNFYVDTDILVKTCLLRTIRLCISSPATSQSLQLSALLIETEWHYLIITSVEREPLVERVEEWRGGGEMVTQDYLVERMQVSTLLSLIVDHYSLTTSILVSPS